MFESSENYCDEFNQKYSYNLSEYYRVRVRVNGESAVASVTEIEPNSSQEHIINRTDEAIERAVDFLESRGAKIKTVSIRGKQFSIFVSKELARIIKDLKTEKYSNDWFECI